MRKPVARGLLYGFLCLILAIVAPSDVVADQPYHGRVLVVVTCHADDFSIFAGGSIAKLVDQGYKGYLVRITDDEKSGGPDPQHNAAQNDREVREVASRLGLSGVYSLHFKNDELGRVPHERIRDAVMYYLRRLKADTIYTFDPYATYGEENPDHLAGGRAAEDAARHAGNAKYAPDQLRSGLLPHAVRDGYYWGRAPMDINTVVDTTAYLDRKMDALALHLAQFSPSTVPYFREYDESIGRLYGMHAAEVSHHIWYTEPSQPTTAPVRAKDLTPRRYSSPEVTTFQGKVVVVVSPHGADYVQAIGGTIAKAAQEGAQIYLVRVTDDERHGRGLSRIEARTRLEEQTKQAAQILGIRRVIDLDLKDGEIAEVPETELRSRFAEIFRVLAPDAIFTSDPWAGYDLDSDDVRIGHAAEDAAWSGSHESFYPEIVLEPKTAFKVIANRYFWTQNGGRQRPNHTEEISAVASIKAQAIAAMPTAFPERRTVAGSTERCYYYHAANPQDWFRDWLQRHRSNGAKPQPEMLKIDQLRSKRVVVITPEISEWLVNAGTAIQQLGANGAHITLIRIGNGEKDGGTARQFIQIARSAGISDVVSLDFREGELSATPPLMIRDRLVELLRGTKPDTVVLPDAWQAYTTHESMVAGTVGADAILQWSLSEPTATVRILYWRAANQGGSLMLPGDLKRKQALLAPLSLATHTLAPREYFELTAIDAAFREQVAATRGPLYQSRRTQ